MNQEDSNLKCSVEQTINDAINQLHNIEGEDRYARLIEIIDWLCEDYENLDLEYFKVGSTNVQGTEGNDLNHG